MIPTPPIPYLAILPGVDNLAASHGDFFRNSIVYYFPKFSKGERHFLSGSLSSLILSHTEHVCVMLSIWINLLTWLKILPKLYSPTTSLFFFRPRLPGRKGNTEKEGGQAAAKKRSPLLRMWKRDRARSAKVHACGAQINREFQHLHFVFFPKADKLGI